MSSELLPKAPSGTSAFKRWCDQVLSFCQASRVVESPDIKPIITSRGTALRLVRKNGAGVVSLNFRGEWSAGETYSEGDVVIYGSSLNLSVLSDGKKAGTYIANQDIAPEDNQEPGEPNSGSWSTFARFATPTFAVAAGTSNTPKILMVADLESPRQVFTASNTTGRITIDLAHANGKAIAIREIGVCVNGVNKKMLVLGSEIY